jgi:hypothetical protein
MVSRLKAAGGVADAARLCGPPKGGRSPPQVQLLQPRVVGFLVLDVFPYHLLVSSDGGNKVAPRPEVLTYEIALLFAIPMRRIGTADEVAKVIFFPLLGGRESPARKFRSTEASIYEWPWWSGPVRDIETRPKIRPNEHAKPSMCSGNQRINRHKAALHVWQMLPI